MFLSAVRTLVYMLADVAPSSAADYKSETGLIGSFRSAACRGTAGEAAFISARLAN
jgi:hypothetical protein